MSHGVSSSWGALTAQSFNDRVNASDDSALEQQRDGLAFVALRASRMFSGVLELSKRMADDDQILGKQPHTSVLQLVITIETRHSVFGTHSVKAIYLSADDDDFSYLEQQKSLKEMVVIAIYQQRLGKGNNLDDSAVLKKVPDHFISVTSAKMAITSDYDFHLMDIDSGRMSKTSTKSNQAMSPFQLLGHLQPSTTARNLAQ